MCNFPNLDLVNMNAYAKFGKSHQVVLKILSGNKILTSIKGHNSVINLQKVTLNNPNLDLVNMKGYAKFCPIPSN